VVATRREWEWEVAPAGRTGEAGGLAQAVPTVKVKGSLRATCALPPDPVRHVQLPKFLSSGCSLLYFSARFTEKRSGTLPSGTSLHSHASLHSRGLLPGGARGGVTPPGAPLARPKPAHALGVEHLPRLDLRVLPRLPPGELNK
jgi:hypothetical protein